MLNKEEDTFKKYFEGLRRELHNAYWHYMIYKQLDKARVEYLNELLQAPVFFSLTERSHLLDSIMRVNKICEANPHSANIFQLLNYIENNLIIFSNESYKKRTSYWGLITGFENLKRPRINQKFINEQRQKYISFQNTKIKKLRNRTLAHIDIDNVINEVMPFKDYNLIVGELETIINETDNTLNTLGIAFDGSRYNKEFPQITEGMKNMFECIRRGVQRS
jgi:ribosomal protein L21E